MGEGESRGGDNTSLSVGQWYHFKQNQAGYTHEWQIYPFESGHFLIVGYGAHPFSAGIFPRVERGQKVGDIYPWYVNAHEAIRKVHDITMEEVEWALENPENYYTVLMLN